MIISLIILCYLICAKMWSKFTFVMNNHFRFKGNRNLILKSIILIISTIVIFVVDTIKLKIGWYWIFPALVVLLVIKTTFDVIAKGKNGGLEPITTSETPVWIRLIIIIVLTIILNFI